MRVIGYIEHPTIKMSIFKMDNKLSIKCEGGLCELIYKFREDDSLKNAEDVNRLVDAHFVESVEKQLMEMQEARFALLSRKQPRSLEDEFEEII